MFDKLKALWARVQVRWHILALALLASLPEILDYLGVVNLRPILSQVLPENYVAFIVGTLPFVLALVKPLVALEPKDPE